MSVIGGNGFPKWDIFLAYPSASWREAGVLFEILSPDLKVFWDRKSLQAGAEFDLAIPDAMRSSRMTAVLVDTGFSMAHYARAESIFAIALAQEDPGDEGIFSYGFVTCDVNWQALTTPACTFAGNALFLAPPARILPKDLS